MSRVEATFQDGTRATATGTWKMMKDLYDVSRESTPENIKTYRFLTLYNDDDIGMGSCMHLSEEQARQYYKRIQNTLDKAQKPRYGVSDDEVAHLIGWTTEALVALGNAFIAYRITERQGGAWVWE